MINSRGTNGIIVVLLAQKPLTPDITSLDPYQHAEPVLQLSKSYPVPRPFAKEPFTAFTPDITSLDPYLPTF